MSLLRLRILDRSYQIPLILQLLIVRKITLCPLFRSAYDLHSSILEFLEELKLFLSTHSMDRYQFWLKRQKKAVLMQVISRDAL